jgi:hypothetical protein
MVEKLFELQQASLALHGTIWGPIISPFFQYTFDEMRDNLTLRTAIITSYCTIAFFRHGRGICFAYAAKLISSCARPKPKMSTTSGTDAV